MAERRSETVRPAGSGGGGGGIGAALPTTPSVNSPVGNETGSQTTGSFRDVPRDYWGYNYIETLKSHQIVNGDENGNFNPEAQITREEFLKMLMNALGIAINDIKDVNLTDVSGSDWCYPYIAKAMELGIVSGVTETTFGTRKQHYQRRYGSDEHTCAGGSKTDTDTNGK